MNTCLKGAALLKEDFFFFNFLTLTTTKLNPVKKSGIYVPVKCMKDSHVWSFERLGCNSLRDIKR